VHADDDEQGQVERTCRQQAPNAQTIIVGIFLENNNNKNFDLQNKITS
jgi:hypothetical protein